MSNPPISCPSIYSCGYVGHLEYALSPSRTSVSSKILKEPNFAPALFKTSTIFELKPQRGCSGDPFINSMTGFCFTNFSSFDFKSDSGFAGEGTEIETGAEAEGEDAKAATFLVSSGVFAPTTESTTDPFFRNMKEGTDDISYFSEISGEASASTLRKRMEGYCSDSCCTTRSICVQGIAQGAQKYARHKPSETLFCISAISETFSTLGAMF
mmetsp:Transcript_14068/g.23271  ORF Transcript_14068/g.23271 Transcript_14068/m.23271 type:complete len:212 (-) Transcript_14068:45-680(-)